MKTLTLVPHYPLEHSKSCFCNCPEVRHVGQFVPRDRMVNRCPHGTSPPSGVNQALLDQHHLGLVMASLRALQPTLPDPGETLYVEKGCRFFDYCLRRTGKQLAEHVTRVVRLSWRVLLTTLDRFEGDRLGWVLIFLIEPLKYFIDSHKVW